MRDRLIELINNGTDKYRVEPLINGCRESFDTFLADHLLANGVIVPPCKVGSKVYYLTSIDTKEELNVCDLFEGVVLSIAYDGKDIWICAHYTNGLYYYHTANDFGKTVFLTREEAEQALKGGGEG